MSIKQIVENADAPAGRAFDLTIQAFIVISLFGFCVETLPDLSESARFWLFVVEVAVVAVFTIEYVARILVADDKLQFIFSFYGLIDLAAILPFYLSAGVDLRAVRVLRLFRVFRALKLLRYTKAIHRFKRAFLDIREELILYLFATSMLIFLSSIGIYYCESEAQPDAFGSVFHCFWWAIVTLTTVGYGDVFPVTVGGRIFTSLVLILGVGTVAVPSGLFASALTKSVNKE
jgi:voltage-gated potassium channel